MNIKRSSYVAQPSDTLEYFIINENGILFGEELDSFKITVRKQLDLSVILDKYYSGKKITILSNGVQNVFLYKNSTITVERPIEIYASEIVKAINLSVPFPPLGVVNMSEAYNFLLHNDFLAYTLTFDSVQTILSYPLSNLSSFENLIDKTIARTTDTIPLLAPKAKTDLFFPTSIINKEHVTDRYIPKYSEMGTLGVINDEVLSIKGENLSFIDLVFEDNTVPLNDEESVSVSYAVQHMWNVKAGEQTISDLNDNLIPTGVLHNLYIDSSVESKSPINVEYIVDLENEYVPLNNLLLINPVIKRTQSLEDNSLFTIQEMKTYIGEYFDSLSTSSIDSLTAYERYMEIGCQTEYLYLKHNYHTGYKRTYIGYNVDNKFSIINKWALINILLSEDEEYNSSMPIVKKASIYFRDQDLLIKFGAYAKNIGISMDVSTDSIARSFKAIREVSCRLGAWDIKAIPFDPDIFIPKPTRTTLFIPPLFGLFFPIRGNSFMLKPIFTRLHSVYFASPPSFGDFSIGGSNQRAAIPMINRPVYFGIQEYSVYIPPAIGGYGLGFKASNHITRPTITNDEVLDLYVQEDPPHDYLTLFLSTNNCEDRFKATSSRMINMMEVGVVSKLVAEHVVTEKYYFLSRDSNKVITRAQMTAIVIGDIFCAAQKDSLFFTHINMQNTLKTEEEYNNNGGNTNTISVCTLDGGAGATIGDKNFVPLVFEHEGVVVNGGGTLSLNSTLERTEILDTNIYYPAVILPWSLRRGSSSYETLIRDMAESIKEKTDAYINGMHEDSPLSILSIDRQVSSVGHITGGEVLVEYIKAERAGDASAFLGMADPSGVYEDTMDIDHELMSELFYPYTNVIVGNLNGYTPTNPRTGDYSTPIAGVNSISMWKPKNISGVAELSSLSYLGLDSTSEAVFSIYGPIIFIYKDGNNFYYDITGDATVTGGTMEVRGENYYTLTSYTSTIVIDKTILISAPTERAFPRDICDSWMSPLVGRGIISMGFSSISPLIMSGSGTRSEMQIINVPTKMGDQDDESGCEIYNNEGTSGIDPFIISNISDLTSLDPNAPTQVEGEVPGAISLSLNFKLSKYAPLVDGGEIVNRVETTRTSICLTIGIIDGIQDNGGDILAQGYTEEELPLNGDVITYLAPSPRIKPYLEFERRTVGQYECSLFTFDISTTIEENLVNTNNSRLFKEYLDVSTGFWEDAEVRMHSGVGDMDEDTPYGYVSIGDFRTPGLSYIYKHAGQDPFYPIIKGVAGSAEIDFVNGKRLVSTIAGSTPVTVYTKADNADEEIPKVDLHINSVHFFINNRTIQILCKDTRAMLSENRTIKIIMED